MGRELVVGPAEAAQVDEAPHPRRFGRFGEVAGGDVLLLTEVAGGRAKRVDQIVRGVDAGQGCGERARVEHVAPDHLRGLGDPGNE